MVSIMLGISVDPESVGSGSDQDWVEDAKVDVIEEQDLMLERELLDLEEAHEPTDERRNKVEEEHENTQISGTKVGAN